MTTGTPGKGQLRTRIERRSAVALVYLQGPRRPLFALIPLAAMGGMLLLPGLLAAACGLTLLAVLSWLTYLRWPHVPDGHKTVRALSLAIVVAIIVVQVLDG